MESSMEDKNSKRQPQYGLFIACFMPSLRTLLLRQEFSVIDGDWLSSGQFNLFGCREQGLGLRLFSPPGFKAWHDIKHWAAYMHRRTNPIPFPQLWWLLTGFNLLEVAQVWDTLVITLPGQLFPLCSRREALGPEDSLHILKWDWF